MTIIGQPIMHKTFGSGIVTDLATGIVTVCFQKNEKRFIYPDAFKNFLILKDRETREYVEKLIADREAAIQRKKQAEQLERDRRQKILNFKATANSHAVFNIPAGQVEQACKTYTVSTGTYLSGYSKGKPRIADRMKPNSVCLITERPAGQAEQERRIIGAFMVKEDYFGEDVPSGSIEGHPQYRLLVPAEGRLLFWKFVNKNTPPRWGNTAFKYCSDDVMNQILSELTGLLEATEQREAAIAFYRYFCKMNRLHPLIRLETEDDQEAAQ